MPRCDAYDDDDDDGDGEAPWDALGRGTAAGKALFNLYNGRGWQQALFTTLFWGGESKSWEGQGR
jgi:hypothetical protein